MPEGSTQASTWQALYVLHRKLRRHAWIAIVVAEVDLIVWGMMAALIPQYLPGPTGTAMVAAGYEGFTHHAWAELAARTAAFITLEFRLFGVLCMTIGIIGLLIAATAFRRGERWAWWALFIGNTVAFGAPMFYDRIVHSFGPFELTEYLGITLVYIALIITVPRHERDDDAPPIRSQPAHR
jgi:hypothetical protein